MLTKQDVLKLLNTVYYNGEYAVKYHEKNDDGTFNLNNEYLGFPPYDDDGFLNIHTSPCEVVIYEAITSFPPREELLNLLREIFPDKSIETGEDAMDEAPSIHYVTITF